MIQHKCLNISQVLFERTICQYIDFVYTRLSRIEYNNLYSYQNFD